MKRGAEKLLEFSTFINTIRDFLTTRGALEVFTPALVPAGAFEGALDCLSVFGTKLRGQLHTSPEIEMKVLLAKHRRSLYQICPSFRDDPDTGIHFPEFLMLEYYFVDTDYRFTRELTLQLFNKLAGRELPFRELTVAAAMDKALGWNFTHTPTHADFFEAAHSSGVSARVQDSWDEIFFKVLLERLEPALDPKVPTLLYDYPGSQGVLSRKNASGLAERFEIYWQGMELCNGCSEQTALADLKTSWAKEQADRRSAGKAIHPEPLRLWEAATLGLPSCSGVAVGLDRLFHCLQI